MREEFEPQYDIRVSFIFFIEEGGRSTIKIMAQNKEKALELEAEILATRRIYDMDTPADLSLTAKQNFEVECDEAAATLVLSGNLFNAFNLLRSRELLPADVIKKIVENKKTQVFLENTKNFVIEFDGEESEASPRADMERAAALRKEYLAALMRLNSYDLEESLAQLAHDLASEGKDLLEIKKAGPSSDSPKVY